MSAQPEVEAMLAWHSALNAADIDGLVSLSTDDIEVGGPRGTGHGIELLREWVDRAHIRLEPVRWQADRATVVVEQTAQWQAGDGSLTSPQIVASVFRMDRGKVASVIRYAEFEAALTSAGLARS
jgi:SnoaL-like domain